MAGPESLSHAPVGVRESPAPIEPQETDIRLSLPARAENVAVVRHVLGALSDALGLQPALTEDIRLAVTEACTNVVRHAYNGDDGTIDVTVSSDPSALEVVVADAGRGIGPSPDTSGPGIGLPLIAALTDSVRVERTQTQGSRLTMCFLRARESPSLGVA